MTSPIVPLGESLWEWSRKNNHRLPPYPTPELLALPTIMPAPVLPDEVGAAMRMAVETWRTGIAVLTSHRAGPAPITEAVLLCVQQLIALGIPPAEFLLYRVSSFYGGQAHNKLAYPPLGFVYAPGGLQKALEALDQPGQGNLWLGALQGVRKHWTPQAHEAQKLWHQLRNRMIQGQLREEDTVAYFDQVKLCRASHVDVQKELDKQVLCGSYVW